MVWFDPNTTYTPCATSKRLIIERLSLSNRFTIEIALLRSCRLLSCVLSSALCNALINCIEVYELASELLVFTIPGFFERRIWTIKYIEVASEFFGSMPIIGPRGIYFLYPNILPRDLIGIFSIFSVPKQSERY